LIYPKIKVSPKMENLEFWKLQKFEFQEAKESRICAKVKCPVGRWNKLTLS